MFYVWDEKDRQANLEKHGVDFAQVEAFDWSTARVSPTPEEEEAINKGIASDPDTWEWTEEEWASSRPAIEVVPNIVKAYREGRLTIAPHLRKKRAKTRVTIRLDADVVARLRADGPGWQTRANAALREAVLGE